MDASFLKKTYDLAFERAFLILRKLELNAKVDGLVCLFLLTVFSFP